MLTLVTDAISKSYVLWLNGRVIARMIDPAVADWVFQSASECVADGTFPGIGTIKEKRATVLEMEKEVRFPHFNDSDLQHFMPATVPPIPTVCPIMPREIDARVNGEAMRLVLDPVTGAYMQPPRSADPETVTLFDEAADAPQLTECIR